MGEYDEAMVTPSRVQRDDSVAWQVTSTLPNEITWRFGWIFDHMKNKWIKFGEHQLMSAYGVNKISIHLQTFLSKDMTLTRWPIEVVKNEIQKCIDIVAIDISIDPLCKVKDEDLDTIDNTIFTICRIQAYKPEGGFTMERIGEERKVLITERKNAEQRKLRDNLPLIGGGRGREEYER